LLRSIKRAGVRNVHDCEPAEFVSVT
jgi:hypothetical protein